MKRRLRIYDGLAPVAVLIVGCGAQAGAIWFVDKDAWVAAVGPFTTIGFCDFPAGTFVTNQYSELGVLFTDGEDVVVGPGHSVYLDGWGLNGVHSISLLFDAPQRYIAVDYPGAIWFRLFSSGVLVADIGCFCPGGYGNFAGLISLHPFDSAVLTGYDGGPYSLATIDDLHFGALACGPDLDGDGRVGHDDLMGLFMAWGTHPQGPPDLDGDGEVGIVDFLQLLGAWGLCPFVPDCNHNDVWDKSDIDTGTSQDCNHNHIPDECDIADGTNHDYNGDGIPDECQPPPNDNCQNAIAITDGATPFNTLGATTAAPLAICQVPFTIVKDIWFLYAPSCTGLATFSLCNDASFDTRLAVYYAGSCPPPLNPLACSDDAPGCGQTSRIELPVVQVIPYLVRVGGRQGGGIGTLTVSCQPLP